MLISAMEVLINGVIYSKIKVILHSFIGFEDDVEPTKNQLYSIGRLRYRKVDVKKVCNLAESLDNTNEFGQKIVHYLTLTEKELESYVASLCTYMQTFKMKTMMKK